MPRTAHLDGLEILFGQATPAEARVYVRWKGDLPAGSQLAGIVRGPKCEYQHTLQAELPLIDRGPGDGLLAESLVVDPCFWTPGHPFLYHLHVRLVVDGQTLAEEQRWFGLRHLGVVDGRVRWDHEPYVLRAIRTAEPPLEDLPDWHDDAWGVVLPRASDVFCEDASRLGVALAAEVAGPADECLKELWRLAEWPAVMLAVVDCEEPLPAEAARLGLLLASRTGRSNDPPPDWAQIVIRSPGDEREDARHAVIIEAAEAAGDRESAAACLQQLQHPDACGYLL